jgi:hypothetical protein
VQTVSLKFKHKVDSMERTQCSASWPGFYSMSEGRRAHHWGFKAVCAVMMLLNLGQNAVAFFLFGDLLHHALLRQQLPGHLHVGRVALTKRRS